MNMYFEPRFKKGPIIKLLLTPHYSLCIGSIGRGSKLTPGVKTEFMNTNLSTFFKLHKVYRRSKFELTQIILDHQTDI